VFRAAAVRRRLFLAVTALAIGLAVVVPAPSGSAGTTAQQLQQAKAERAALQERLAAVASELEDVSARIDETTATYQTLEADVAALQQDAVEAEEALLLLAQESYQGGQGELLTLLNATDPDQALDRARFLESLGRAEQETIERAEAARRSLGTRREELERLGAALAEDQERVARLRGDLEVAFGQASDREGELATRQARQRQIDRPGQRGTYACPLDGAFTFRDTWGAPRSGGRRHKGVDMFAPMGAPVYAMTDGVIARHSTSRLGGLSLYLSGDDGNLYYYAHLQRILPDYGPGRRVEAGELIAANGDSGNARGGSPHIHFEVHPGGGGPVPPYAYSAAACF